MEMTIRFHANRALWPWVNARICTDCGTNNNEYCRDDEKEALKPSRGRTVFDESPNNVLAVHKVREKSSGNHELVNQRLMTIFEISGFHCQDASRMCDLKHIFAANKAYLCRARMKRWWEFAGELRELH